MLPAHEGAELVNGLLKDVRRRGVRLWIADGRLHYQAPKGVLSREEMENLRLYREQLATLLTETTAVEVVEPRATPRPLPQFLPLAFSQLAHWNACRLGEKRVPRGVSSATRLRGPINIPAFRRAVAATIQRHEALRTRIVVRNGFPMQEVVNSSYVEVAIDDLTTLAPERREAEADRLLDERLHELIDVTVDPLLGIWLLKISSGEHVLIVAMEHIISDGISRNILLRDIFSFYLQDVKCSPQTIPEVPIQFSDYALWQRSTHESWKRTHGTYWRERFADHPRLRFPKGKIVCNASRSGFGIVSVPIDRNLVAELRDACRKWHTTLPICMFAAYIGFVLRWCNISESVFLYETDGRFSRNIQDTIGYFAFPLYLRVHLSQDDRFPDLLRRVTSEYCNAYEHADYSYMEAQSPRYGFTHNTRFNWIPRGPSTSRFELDSPEGLITGTLIPFTQRVVEDHEMNAEPAFGVLEMDDGIDVSMEFPLDQFCFENMEEFVRGFVPFLRESVMQLGAHRTG